MARRPAVRGAGGAGLTTTTRLRPAAEGERGLLARWRSETTSEFEDFGGDPPPGTEPGPPWPHLPGSGELVVTGDDDVPLGVVSWRPVPWGPNAGSVALDIGISLREHARGKGHGARAQRLLADYLFTTTAVHRLQASTDVENVAEQRALERAGFRREGVVRGAQWRRGRWHDLVAYALLRDEHRSG